MNIKNYTFVLIPEKITKEKIENLRLEYTGNKLVDGLPPHISIKRRFTLDKDLSENDLKHILDKFNTSKVTVHFNNMQKFSEVFALVGENSKLLDYHKKLLGELEGKVKTKNPTFEGEGFKIHLTLFRGVSPNIAPNILEKEITFDKICLYELDPSTARSFANKIACKSLKD